MMSTTMEGMARTGASARVAADENVLDGAAAAFGMAAAIAIVFNTALAWVKDAYAPLNSFMASLSGHHWRTHGVVDVIVFLALGYLFMQRGFRINGMTLAAILVGAIVVGGGGLALWFLLV
jgi:hypothetical protein